MLEYRGTANAKTNYVIMSYAIITEPLEALTYPHVSTKVLA